MVAEALDISRETYLAILMDPATQGPVLVGSPDGGVDIEEIAEKNPERIFKVSHFQLVRASLVRVTFIVSYQIPVDIMKGITMDQALLMAKNLEFKEELRDTAATQIMKLYDLFCGVDATQVEINPFGETPDGRGTCTCTCSPLGPHYLSLYMYSVASLLRTPLGPHYLSLIHVQCSLFIKDTIGPTLPVLNTCTV